MYHECDIMTYVNCYKEDCTHYCGRKSSLKKARGNPVDLSILGNPEPLKNEADRKANLLRYAKHLLDLCRHNRHIREILISIPDDAKLGCFCHPKECHCLVIIGACEYLKEYPNL